MSTAEELPTDKKPLVFISAARKNSAWRERLTKKLDGYADLIEWWDSSKIPRDQYDYEKDQPDAAIARAAIARASVAVILFSYAYLNSDLARAEFEDLEKRAEADKLKLFPVIFEPSAWGEIPAFQGLPVVKWTRPVDDVSEGANDELEKIAKSIVELAQSTVSTLRVPETGLYLSSKGTAILEHAWRLAETSNRGRITSSCLLFALAETPADDDETQSIKLLLRSSHRYDIEFQRFFKEGKPGAEEPVRLVAVPWPLTKNLSAILRRALNISQIVSLTVPSIEDVDPRHLFAALITRRWDMIPGIRDRLRGLAFDPASLRSTLRESVRELAPFEYPEGWDDVLGTQASTGKPATETITPPPDAPAYKNNYSFFTPDRAAFGPRVTGPLDDSLGVRTYAGHLAQLIAAKDTFMPLSIGLFGAWGAGKSHFIDLLDEELRDITKNPSQKFHKQIVQIRFNAWHYLDTNLWANLVSEIFDQLFATVEGRGEEDAEKLKNLKQELAAQSALAAEANAALLVAQNVREEAETKLGIAMKARAEQENTVSKMLDDLKELVVDDELKKQLRDVANGLGLPKVESSFNELEARVDEVRSLSGRGRALLLAVFTGPGRWKRAILLVAALATPLAIAWLAANGGPRIENLLAGAGKTIAQLVTVIGLISAWLGAQAKAGNTLVSKLELAYDKVKAVRLKREAKDDAAKAQVTLAQTKEAEEQARQNLREAEQKLKNIQTELAEMSPGRQLIRFLRARATAEDYRRHLGLVSLVRKDFYQLSKLLTDPDSADDKLPKIDRIVLYIDDLDRCRADRVIEVLEAVHLLLAFPLFAVVVAVDARWLRQSLLDHYPRLLGAIDATQRTSSLGRAATPQDYLEKIFQVPFNLQPMEKTGFESLVKQVFSVESPKSPEPASSPETKQPMKITAVDLKTTPETAEEQTKLISNQIRTQFSLPETTVKAPAKQLPPDPERLVLTENEVKDVQRFQLLFQTPRALKRFANTYSLIRVGVSPSEWTDYLGFNGSSPNYRVPLLMLAVSAAFPSLARPWLIWLRETPPTHWQLDADAVAALATKNNDTTERADWEKLQQCLNRLDLDGWTPPNHEVLAMWVPRVARYSF